jgi:hypothetical protein
MRTDVAMKDMMIGIQIPQYLKSCEQTLGNAGDIV